MANIRIKDLPADPAPKKNDIIPIDLTGTRGATVKDVVESGRPTANKTEAELGVDPQKAMTPLTTKQAIDSQVGSTYVPKTVKVNAGTGISGGGALSGDVTVGLSAGSVASLAKADSAVQSVNGKSGNSVTLVKADVGLGNADNTSDINKPISTATQIALDGKYNNPTGTTAQYIRGDGSLNTFPPIPQGTVTSIGLTVPTGLSASGSPVTTSGTIAISYAAGYQGYTSAEASKLSGIAAGAQVNTVNSVNTKTGAVVLNASDVGAAPDTVVADINANTADRHTHSNKAILDATTASFLAADKTKLTGIEAGAQVNTVTSVSGKTGAVTLVKGDVGLGNVDNTSDASKPVSTATQSALNAKANSSVTVSVGTGLTGGGNLTANRSIALNAASVASLGKADTAIQAPGGTTGQILAKNSNTTNDVAWVSSEAATAVSYGPQTLTEPQKTQARTNIGAFATPAGTTAEYLRGDGTLATMDSSAVGLGNADNTSDANKPVSTAQAAAIALKVTKSGDSLTGGFTASIVNDGTQSSGTYTPTPIGGNYRLIVRGGAFTLAAPTVAGDYQIIIKVGTGSGAGAVTFTGFTKVDGATLVNTAGKDYLFIITKVYDVLTLDIKEAN